MRNFIFLFLVFPVLAFGADAEIVLMKNGEIFPTMAVATVADITSNAVQAVAVAQAALRGIHEV